jgi:hypothetical protein
MFAKTRSDFDHLQRLVPDAEERVTRVQNTVMDCSLENSGPLRRALEGEFQRSQQFTHTDKGIYSAVCWSTDGPSPRHVPSSTKSREYHIPDSPYYHLTPDTPIPIANTLGTQAGDLSDHGWMVDIDERPETGNDELSPTEQFSTMLAARRAENGDVESFIMSQLDKYIDEGGKTNYSAWQYSQKTKDGTVQTFNGTGATATKIHARPLYWDTQNGVREKTEYKGHTITSVQEERPTEDGDEGKGASDPSVLRRSARPLGHQHDSSGESEDHGSGFFSVIRD